MRLLLSALLAASVSFTAFTPAQACISACGGGGGSSSSSSGGSSTSSSSDESSNTDQYTGQDTSAIGAFIDAEKLSPNDVLVAVTFDGRTIQISQSLHAAASEHRDTVFQAEYDRISDPALYEDTEDFEYLDGSLGELFYVAPIIGLYHFFANMESNKVADAAFQEYIEENL